MTTTPVANFTRCAHEHISPGDEVSQLLCNWQPLVHHTLQYQHTFQPVIPSLGGQIQVDLAAQMDTARADTTEQGMQQTSFFQLRLC